MWKHGLSQSSVTANNAVAEIDCLLVAALYQLRSAYLQFPCDVEQAHIKLSSGTARVARDIADG